jgi:hypothetical protein
MFVYPSKVHIYEPLSMCTLQTRPSAAARAVAEVPGAMAAAKHTNAQATSKKLIVVLINLVFIVSAFFFFDFPSLFWPSVTPRHESHFCKVTLSFENILPACQDNSLPGTSRRFQFHKRGQLFIGVRN